MNLWHRYIAWVDRDLGNGWPKMNGLSSLIAFVPLTLALVYALIVHPNEKPSLVEDVLFIPPTIVLFCIWLWRVALCALRQVRAIRQDGDSGE